MPSDNKLRVFLEALSESPGIKDYLISGNFAIDFDELFPTEVERIQDDTNQEVVLDAASWPDIQLQFASKFAELKNEYLTTVPFNEIIDARQGEFSDFFNRELEGVPAKYLYTELDFPVLKELVQLYINDSLLNNNAHK